MLCFGTHFFMAVPSQKAPYTPDLAVATRSHPHSTRFDHMCFFWHSSVLELWSQVHVLDLTLCRLGARAISTGGPQLDGL